MKSALFALAAALAAFAGSACAATVGVSISIGDPHFYGRVDIGGYPRPELIYRTPVVIIRDRVRVAPAPIYLRVPPGHAKRWSKHCREYDACGRPVYFIQDRWYSDVYVPRYQERRIDRRDLRQDDRRDDRDERRDDRREYGDEGKGKGHDKGYDKGHDKDRDKGHHGGKGHDD